MFMNVNVLQGEQIYKHLLNLKAMLKIMRQHKIIHFLKILDYLIYLVLNLVIRFLKNGGTIS
jgi:hypothetical protein